MPQLDDATQLNAALERIEAIMHTEPYEAIKLCEQVFTDARRLREPLPHVVAAERYGLIMDHLGRGVEGRNVLFEAMQVAQSARLFVNEGRLLEQIARGYYTVGEYRQAIQYWARCAEVSDQSGDDTRTWILAKIGLGQVYTAINDPVSGLALLKAAESRIHEVDDPHLDAKVKINIGVSLADSNQLEEAADIFRRALAICVEHEFWDYIAESNLRLAQVALMEGNVDRATAYLEEAIPQARKVNYRWGESFILATLAEAQARRGDYVKAMETVRSAQAISEADGFGHMLIQQHFAASRYAKERDDFKVALEEFTTAYDAQQDMLNATASERNRELEEKAGLRPSVNRLLVELSNNHLVEEGQLEPAFRLILQEGSRILNVSRVAVWLLDRETSTMVCRCLYLSDSGEFIREPVWRRKDCTNFFDRLLGHNPVVAHDALHHPDTWELEDAYLIPRNIKSMLIFPLSVAGQTAGVLCFEVVGDQRNWTPDDILHGNQLMEVTARVVSSYERKQFQQEISALNEKMMQANQMLEQRVIERTASLERHTVELHELQDKLFHARHQLREAEKLVSPGRLAMQCVEEMGTAAAHMAANAEMLEKHVANLLLLLAEYEAVEAALPEAQRSRIEKSRMKHDIASLRSDVSRLLNETRQEAMHMQERFASVAAAAEPGKDADQG